MRRPWWAASDVLVLVPVVVCWAGIGVGEIGVVTLARRLLKWCCCWDVGERDPTSACSCPRDGWVLEMLLSNNIYFRQLLKEQLELERIRTMTVRCRSRCHMQK